jgi:hypothetical protein
MNRVRNVGREGVLAALFAVLAIAGLGFLVFGAGEDQPANQGPDAPARVAGDVVLRDKIISDGEYNAFAGAWLTPRRGSVATAFVHVSGPAAPPCTGNDKPARCDDRGFRGAKHRFVVLQTRNDGKSWKRPFADETLPSAMPHAYTGQPVIALRAREGTRAGTLLRRVNGEDIAGFSEFKDIPATAFLQRRAPGADRWSGQQILLDPTRYTYNISRIERLRDGRTLVALGAFWRVRAGERLKTPAQEVGEWLLMRSTDEGETWQNAMEVSPGALNAAPANEWDIAELYDGDLLAVMRTREGKRQVRKQVVLEHTDDTITTNTGSRSDGGWRMGTPILTTSDFPQVDTPQHPELLSIEHGAGRGGILHIADEAAYYTADAGDTWTKVEFPGDWSPHYYPIAVQAAFGNIYVFSQAGVDEPYTAAANKPIYVDVIRIVADRGDKDEPL